MDLVQSTLHALIRRTGSSCALVRTAQGWSAHRVAAGADPSRVARLGEWSEHEGQSIEAHAAEAAAPSLEELCAQLLHEESSPPVSTPKESEHTHVAAVPSAPTSDTTKHPDRNGSDDDLPRTLAPMVVTFANEELELVAHTVADVRDMVLTQDAIGQWQVDLTHWLGLSLAPVGARVGSVDVVRGAHVIDGSQAHEMQTIITVAARLTREADAEVPPLQAAQEAVNAHFAQVGTSPAGAATDNSSSLKIGEQLWNEEGLLLEKGIGVAEKVIGVISKREPAVATSALFTALQARSGGQQGMAIVWRGSHSDSHYQVRVWESGALREVLGDADELALALTQARRTCAPTLTGRLPLISPVVPSRADSGAWPNHPAATVRHQYRAPAQRLVHNREIPRSA